VFNAVMIVIAAISLLVGGIGIANIMLATITSGRGRSASAARWGAAPDILLQFLTETAAIGASADCSVACSDLAAIRGIVRYTAGRRSIEPHYVIVALVISCCVAILAGIYPAPARREDGPDRRAPVRVVPMAASAFPPHPFPDHALLDCGDGEKLERFGAVVVRRPDPQALWPRALGDGDWRKADLRSSATRQRRARRTVDLARARRARTRVDRPVRRRDVPRAADAVQARRDLPEQRRTGTSSRARRAGFGVERPRLLNLFGYTGVASVLALRAEYEVTHVDASKTSLAWARDNLGASGLAADAMKIVLDDALAFTQREARRAARYQVVLLDLRTTVADRAGRSGSSRTRSVPSCSREARPRRSRARRPVVVRDRLLPLTLENLLADLVPGLVPALERGARARGAASARARSCRPASARAGAAGSTSARGA
jgi:hypothetical protein